VRQREDETKKEEMEEERRRMTPHTRVRVMCVLFFSLLGVGGFDLDYLFCDVFFYSIVFVPTILSLSRTLYY
jgi:hypothetical protein